MFVLDELGFRPLELSDIELVRQMHNEPDTLLQMGDPWLVSPTEQRDWFEAMGKRRSDVVFLVCKVDDQEPIGVWRLQNVDVTNRVCEVGVDIFPAHRRQGYGYKTYRMLLAYLFEHYNMHTVYLRTAEYNTAGQSLYRKAGFRETGRLIESIFRYGRYWDSLLFCLTAAEYRRTVADEL